MKGLIKKEYIGLLKECGMCTKKWTLAKQRKFEERRRELINDKYRKRKHKKLGKNDK